LMHECKKTIDKNFRVLVTTLTKKNGWGFNWIFSWKWH
jgi:excinuclease UvrABC helicase subunit UvrB